METSTSYTGGILKVAGALRDKIKKAKPQMDPMRNRKESHKNVSSERKFRQNMDWISTGNTERVDVLDAQRCPMPQSAQ